MDKIKRIWKQFLLWIGAVVFLSSFTACGRADSADAAGAQLDTVQMVQTATQSQPEETAENDGDASSVDLYARLGAPQAYTAELQSEKGYLSVHVDATVDLPGVELPIVRTQLHTFTSEDAERIAGVLLGDNAHYVDVTQASEHYTKAYLQREIDDLSDSIEHWDSYGNLKYDLRYASKSEAQQALSDWQALQPTLPDSIPAVQPDFTSWQPVQAWDADGQIQTSDTYQYLFTMPNEATVSRLMVQNSPEVLGTCFFDYCRDLQKVYGAMDSNLQNVGGLINVSQENAEAEAQEVVTALGYTDFTCVYRQACLSDNQDFAYYRFFFLRQVDGAPSAYWNSGTYADDNFELIQVGVDDEGILRVSCDNARDVLGEMTAAAELLPFSQIQSVFEKMILVVNNATESEIWNKDDSMRLTADYYISSVRLALASVPESNDTDKRLLVPVWNFYGYSESRVNDNAPETLGTNGQTTLLTINAVDGTVIDWQTGY